MLDTGIGAINARTGLSQVAKNISCGKKGSKSLFVGHPFIVNGTAWSIFPTWIWTAGVDVLGTEFAGPARSAVA